MNIFILSDTPYHAAIQQCDAHVVKMVLESTQLLCNCFPENTFPGQYKRTHYNHPCSIWARESLLNFGWLLDHAHWLALEYHKRYGRIHKCRTVLDIIELIDYSKYFDKFEQTPFALAMPDSCIQFNEKGDIDPIKSYRTYYITKSKTMKRFTYTGRTAPEWL